MLSRVTRKNLPNWTDVVVVKKKELGFVPKYDLKTELVKTVNWYMKNDHH